LFYCVACAAAAGQQPALLSDSNETRAVRLSADGKYLINGRGAPWFINGDAAWSLVAALSREDATFYLEDRGRRGFNLVMVNLLEHKFAPRPPYNYYGARPFDGAAFQEPNEAYFAHAEWVIRSAEANGLVVLLAPLYLGYACQNEGWCVEVLASTPGRLAEYGRYLGGRFRERPNIIWLIGGDADPFGGSEPRGARSASASEPRAVRGLAAAVRGPDVSDRMRAFVRGLKEGGAQHLITAHNAPEQAALDAWPGETWMDLNNVYTYRDALGAARAQAARRPFKPFFLIETYYEHEHGSTPLSLRRQAYWSVLSGGTLGHVFGNCQIWGFSYGNCRDDWKRQLDSEGSRTLALVGRLFQSRPFYRLVPDLSHSVLTRGYLRGERYAAAALADDGSSLIVYIPTRRTVTVDLAKVSGQRRRAWWFNPRSGSATLIGEYRGRGPTRFRTPDDHDWVLVVDNAAHGFRVPGEVGTRWQGLRFPLGKANAAAGAETRTVPMTAESVEAARVRSRSSAPNRDAPGRGALRAGSS
jgi:hypothetical protein